MESKLWKTIWKKKRNSYTVSLVEYPQVAASARNLDEAIEKLEELVSDELHDPTPHFEFVNPLPPEDKKPYIHILAGHNRAEDITNIDELFEAGKCQKCQNYSGARTKELIKLSSVPDGDLTFTAFLGQIISSKLAEFLKLGSLGEIILNPIILNGKKTSDFLEMISAYPREFVALKGVKAVKGGFKCDACGFIVWMYMPYEAKFLEYISERSLPSPDTRVFPVGTGYRMHLSVDEVTRGSLMRSSEFSGIVSRKVGVLTKEQSVPICSFFDK